MIVFGRIQHFGYGMHIKDSVTESESVWCLQSAHLRDLY